MSAGNGASATGLRLLSKSDILAATDLQSEIVEVPEWGGAVRVQGMDVNRRLAFSEYLFTVGADGSVAGKPGRSVALAYAALCIVDESGAPMFTLADVDALGTKSPEALDRVAAVARRLSGHNTSEVDAANLKADASSGSPSASRSPSA